MTPHFDRLLSFLINLECLDAEGRKDAVANEALETGGTYTQPLPEMNDSSHLFELQLYGVTALGHSQEDAIRGWQKAAARLSLDTDLASADPFP